MEVFYKYEKNITINWADLRTFNDIGRMSIFVYRLVSVSILMMYSIVLFAQQESNPQHVDHRMSMNYTPVVPTKVVMTDIPKYQRTSMFQVPVISSSLIHSVFNDSSMDLGFTFMNECISLIKKMGKCTDFSYLRSLSSVASELKENIGLQELTNNETRSGDASEVFSDVEEIDDNPIFVPEAFSPNGDGINDKFEIKGLSKYKTIGIEIFNRWGNIVFRSKNTGEGKEMNCYWDGTVQSGLRLGSNSVPVGMYYYVLRLDDKENISGFVYLDK